MKIYNCYYLILICLILSKPCKGQTISVITQKNLEKELATSVQSIIAITSQDCPICRAIVVPFEQVSKNPDFKDIKFIKMSFDNCTELCSKYNISVVPTFLFMNKNLSAPLYIERGIENQNRFIEDISKKIKEKFKLPS